MDEIVSKNNSNATLFEVAKHAVDIENERKKNLESRAGFALGFLAPTLVFLLPEADSAIRAAKGSIAKADIPFPMSTPIADILPLLNLFSITEILLCFFIVCGFIVSALKFIAVFIPNDYKAIDMDFIINIAFEVNDANLFRLYVTEIYRKQLEKNTFITDIRMKFFEAALSYLRYSFILIGVRYLLKFIFM